MINLLGNPIVHWHKTSKSPFISCLIQLNYSQQFKSCHPNPPEQSSMYERRATEKKDIVFDEVTSFVLITTSPLFLIFNWITYHYFDASITSAAFELLSNNPFDFFFSRVPQLTRASILAYSLWVIVQALFYMYVPGQLHIAPRTPGGRQLRYKLNGLRVWILSVGGAAMLCYNGILDPAIIAIHWGDLLMTANAYALILVLTFWIKARVRPDHQGDTLIIGEYLICYGTSLMVRG